MSVTRVVDEKEPKLPGMVDIDPIIKANRFKIPESIEKQIRDRGYKFGFGAFSDVVFYRTYSREINGIKETFPDVVIRNINGIFSILKNHYITNGFYWEDGLWYENAIEMGLMMMDMKFLPPGRGLYVCGTEYSYTRGGAAFNNCGFVSTENGIINSAVQMMDLLMCGCGIGFDTRFYESEKIFLPGCKECRLNNVKTCGCNITEYVIHDSREGWVKSLYLLLKSYFMKDQCIHFDYSHIRNEGEKINGFGGISSGYGPLEILHKSIRHYMECFFESKEDPFQAAINLCEREGNLDFAIEKLKTLKMEYLDIVNKIKKAEEESNERSPNFSIINDLHEKKNKLTKTYGSSRLVVDIFNSIGKCVIAGNIRRSSEIALGSSSNEEFINLKNGDLNPERTLIEWSSNNSLIMENQDFLDIPLVTERMKVNGEPGILNLVNVQKFGRIGKKHPIGREAEYDSAIGVNPCGEVLLCHGELCNVCEIFPTRCEVYTEMEKAAKVATFYSTTVSLLKTQWSNTNAVISENRRIGVSQSGIADYYDKHGCTKLTSMCKNLYSVVRHENIRLASCYGIRPAKRSTTVKPSGTISLLVGCSAGMHWKEYDIYIRRIRLSITSELVPLMKEAGYPWELDVKDPTVTIIFECPIDQSGGRTAQNVSLWEQAALQMTLQREWSDNAVSVTLKMNPHEEDILENVISQMMPCIKSVSVIPHRDSVVYEQPPYERITKEEYERRISIIKPINWGSFKEKTSMPRGCDGDRCTL
jgi:adenosylcobalamin-dependent ribonucleoside-triphosphate reductase